MTDRPGFIPATDERNATAYASSLAYLKDPGVIRARVLARFHKAPTLEQIAVLIETPPPKPAVDSARRREVKRQLETAWKRHLHVIQEADRLGMHAELLKSARNGDLIAAEYLRELAK